MPKNYQIPDGMPVLSRGRHRNAKRGACFMEFASYLAGERWSDHPQCTHPLLAAVARDVNDLVSDAARARLVPLIDRVVGLTSNDPLVTAMIATRAAAAALPIASLDRQRALAASLIGMVEPFSDVELRTIAAEALRKTPDAEIWGRRYLAASRIPPAALDTQAAAIVHTSTVGISFACVPDADARLTTLLTQVIHDTEVLVRPPAGAEEAAPVFV